MTRILLHGLGAMGKAICQMPVEGCEIVAAVDKSGEKMSFPVFESLDLCGAEADVIVDFSVAEAVPGLMSYAVKRKLPVVVCTTGLSAECEKIIVDAAKEIPVLRSANMSLGVNLLAELLQKASALLYGSGFDIEIVEKHHNKKVDAPSGTALLLADAVNNGTGGRLHYVTDRTAVRQRREKAELGISSVRGGTMPGEHSVIFAGRDEVIELSHRAFSKEIFAAGAIRAAVFLAGKPAGAYSMKDVIDLQER